MEGKIIMRILNIGSGRNYIKEAINIDIDPGVKCDFIFDIADPNSLFIKQFSGQFDLIIAHDVLEHIIDLKSAMTNCLNLLKVGGKMDIIVPYDLSHGAWQDPTHVRAFNEKSWVYYSDWAWYLGWKEYKFEILQLKYLIFSGAKPDRALEEFIKIPRSVDAMQVEMRKVVYDNRPD